MDASLCQEGLCGGVFTFFFVCFFGVVLVYYSAALRDKDK